MFAIVNIKGQQFKVESGQEIFVNNLGLEQGASVDFDEVLLTTNGDSTTIGTPTLKGAVVKATVIEDVKGDTVIVFKKKRRKGYKVKNGHRQKYTKIKIDSISA
jgi:large subunit ribosomal protein L21